MPAASDKLFAEFPPVSTEEWQAAVGKDLLWKSDDGITVKPFYRSEDLADIAPGRRHSHAGWQIRYEIAEPDPGRARTIALEALARGAHEVAFSGTTLESADDIRALTRGIEAAVHFRFGEDAGRILEILPAGLRGSLDYDPVALGAELSPTVRRFAATDFSSVAVNADTYHNAGATAVEELAFAFAAEAHYFRELGEVSAGQLVFNFAVGGNYFFEIAKLRAARRVWAQRHPSHPMRMHTRTSLWNKTIYDAHNNLLRTTTEAMSAAIGGTDSMTVGAFDEVYRRPDDFSRHLALNTQLILGEEAHFDKVADPAAGSWYVEWLTEQIAREALTLAEQIESEGGFLAAVRSGFVAKTIAASREAKLAALTQRRRILVGTNWYPNPRETMLSAVEAQATGRAADAFEQVRLATERHVSGGGRAPVVLLLPYGDAKMRRARADFVTNFFGTAGFAITEPPAFSSREEAAEYARSAHADLLVLCSSDPEYVPLASAVVASVDKPVLVAGFPKDSADQLRATGIRDFIHIKSDSIATLTRWQRELGVTA
jgi:methylmalonyl-CoA mutase